MKYVLLLACLAASSIPASAADNQRPNILWLFAEDTSPWMGCYGDPINRGHTPNIDSLADRGVRFSRAYVPAPVCSACRSALMGGQNQIRFNAHEHRSSRGPAKLSLPDGMKLLPQLVKESGYFTFNLGKTDYNFVWDEPATYSLMRKNRADIPWEDLKDNQPFFGQIQTAGGKNNTTKFPQDRKVDPSTVTVPPDYPQNQIYREVVAQHYDAIRKDDDFIGEVLAGLDEAGLRDNTIVVYFSDHGANNLVRHKQMPTEGGLHVPFIIAGPAPYVPSPSVRDDLVNLLDLSATTLAWAGVDQPEWYEGQNLFDEIVVPRIYVAAAKDRLDHTIDRVRSLRTDRFRYTRNYKTDRIFLQPQYRDDRPFVQNLHQLYRSGELSPTLTEIYFGERPAEEFYDVQQDPSQVHNLIDDEAYADQVQRHRELLDQWLAKGDDGIGEESREELAYQAMDHKWGQAVNPEYELVREDHDGDGLSDKWETINDRDPDDGKLLFQFDCGGWQTEGWTATDPDVGNIAGRLGFLDFPLPGGEAMIARNGLKLSPEQNDGQLLVRLQAPPSTKITLLAAAVDETLQPIGSATTESDDWQTVAIPMHPAKPIAEIRLQLRGKPDSIVQIDSIHIE
ncbi:sulfatase [Roseiconus nitratireducens]|uniref:Sulfatase n=1 Tax=Roseiconus nitratireducens TaxID=2605748 RepID=A0A5M6DED5_9BACT|nr:sulfatase [Roseiconus nitratireducens]KAA5544652.1 sulfatase [Roseiconus nitratireducens]